MQNEMEKLIEELNYHTKLYDEGHPVISDKEWDDMYFRLQELEKTEKPLPNSPTQWVYFSPSLSKLNKVTHNHPMLSLNKTKNLVDIGAFVQGHNWIAMSKLDGLTCSLMYSDGVLISAETRGNGIVGEDILNNILVNPTVPNRINHKGTLIIDGEIICTYRDFEAFKDEYKNPRNFAAGSIRLLDSKESKDRHLTFVAWDVIEGGTSEYLSNNLSELREYGFLTVPFFTDGDLTVLDSVEKIEEESAILSYPIDGAVFKYNSIEEYAAAGKTEHHFKGGLAFKFYDEEYETHLLDIEWSLGRTGVITPVAIFEPVEIDGAEVSRASLHNISVMLEMLGDKPFVGQKIKIAKMNMIIPQIVSAEKNYE